MDKGTPHSTPARAHKAPPTRQYIKLSFRLVNTNKKIKCYTYSYSLTLF